MTTQEMITSFGLQYSSEINTAVPGWEESEILAFLNRSQRDLTKDLAESRQYSRLVEVTAHYYAVMGSTLWNYTDLGGDITNAVAFPKANVDGGIYHLINSSTRITRTNPLVDTEYVSNMIIPEVIASKFAATGLNTPWFTHPRVFFSNGPNPMIVVIYDAYTSVSIVRIEYVMVPVDISLVQNCRLHESLHDEVVNRAVTLAIEALANPRIQTQPVINKSI